MTTAQEGQLNSTRGKELRRPAPRTICTFLSHVEVMSFGEHKGCWLWTGNFRKDAHAKGTPYGRFCFTDPVTKKQIVRHAHRISYAIFTLDGILPAGFDVDHTCGNHRCVNPAHLRLLSRGENIAECNTRTRTKKDPNSNTEAPF